MKTKSTNKKVKVIITPNDMNEQKREEMWAIYQKYYNYTKKEFLTKMGRNNYYSFYMNQGQIVGFTGLRIDQIKVNKRKIFLMYFGQTVIDHAFRGKSLIPSTGFKLFRKFAWQILTSRSFFWADTLTYKAYLVFAKTVVDCYPSRKRETPSTVKKVIDKIGEMYYKDNYVSHNGTVKKDSKFVNDPTVEICPKVLADPDIAFYTKANPNYTHGDGLLTLAEASLKTFSSLLGRTIKGVFKTYQRDVRRQVAFSPLRPQI